MICVSVAPESRRLAKADILNASRQGDLVEVCLDKLIKKPDLGDMLSGCSKPVLVSCRRKKDGGHWDRSEEERLQLLRNAIVASPAYVELEADIASKIPRFGNVKRLISFNSPTTPLQSIDRFFSQARKNNADVVKLSCSTSTLRETWPLLKAVSEKRELPVVGMPVGESDVTFSLLSRKFGSAWTYAALEERMRSHTSQKTIWELNEAYACGEIDRSTRFVGMVGSGQEADSARFFNDAFRELGANVRCLPLKLGSLASAKAMLSRLKVYGLIVGSGEAARTYPLVDHHHAAVEDSKHGDVLVCRRDGWHGYNATRKATLHAIRSTGKDLARRRVLVIGGGSLSSSLLPLLRKADAAVSIATPNNKTAKALAKQHNISAVQWSAIYDTRAEFLIYADPEISVDQASTGGLNPSVLRESMTVVDAGCCSGQSNLIDEARVRGCTVVEPEVLRHHQLRSQFRIVTGKRLPLAMFQQGT